MWAFLSIKVDTGIDVITAARDDGSRLSSMYPLCAGSQNSRDPNDIQAVQGDHSGPILNTTKPCAATKKLTP